MRCIVQGVMRQTSEGGMTDGELRRDELMKEARQREASDNKSTG